MANKRISSLDDITSVGGTSTAEVNANDILPITDVDDTTGSPQGTTKRVTVANLHSGLQAEPAEGPFADGDKTKLDALDSSDYATAVHTHAINDLSDVAITSASNEDVIKFNGTSFVNGQVSVDVNTPLTTALRGTDNPHIGAYPNQSFKVTDNPQKSVMVIADADGNLDFLVKSDSANIYLNTPSARKAASFGFSVVEDSTEPDIEVESNGENYSVISGDSDSLGANGLPIRQGFNLPDIGANPAPILISGGTIA